MKLSVFPKAAFEMFVRSLTTKFPPPGSRGSDGAVMLNAIVVGRRHRPVVGDVKSPPAADPGELAGANHRWL